MASDPKHWTDLSGQSVRDEDSVGRVVFETLTRIWQALEYSAGYLALVGAAEVLVVGWLLSLNVGFAPLVIALVTFAIYANDRLVDVDTDGVSNPRRTAFVERHQRELYVLASLAYGLAAALAALGGPLAFALTLLPGVAWLVYALNWLPATGVGVARLKEIPVVSSLVVAGAWSLAVVGLPVAFAGAAITPAVALVFGYFLLAAAVGVEVANVRDIESDTENGVATLATVLGVEPTRHLLYGVSLLTTMLLAGAVAGGLLTVPAVAALALGVVGMLSVTAFVGRTDAEGALTLAAECTRVPVFVALLVLTAF